MWTLLILFVLFKNNIDDACIIFIYVLVLIIIQLLKNNIVWHYKFYITVMVKENTERLH